ncbi:MAG TPA: hypothetical protein VFR94_13865 [Nitrososphaeraceae archaeon]|nr:hypothetical protein [Nitrososphaeraceae archaeon]
MIRLIIAALITAAILSVLLVLAFDQAGADRGMVSNTTDKESAEAGLISHITEDLGIFTIGLLTR